MLNFVGYMKEKLHLSVNKVQLMKPLGKVDDVSKVAERYLRIGSVYAADNEDFISFRVGFFGKKQYTPFPNFDSQWSDKHIKYYYFDAINRIWVTFKGGVIYACGKEECDRYKVGEAAKNVFVNSSVTGWVLPLIIGLLCLVVGLFVGQFVKIPVVGA